MVGDEVTEGRGRVQRVSWHLPKALSIYSCPSLWGEYVKNSVSHCVLCFHELSTSLHQPVPGPSMQVTWALATHSGSAV